MSGRNPDCAERRPCTPSVGLTLSAWRTVTYLARGRVLRVEELSHTRSTVLGRIHHCLHTGQLYDEHKALVAIADNGRRSARAITGPGLSRDGPVLSTACPKFPASSSMVRGCRVMLLGG